ncbi:hypothetical protein CDD81_1470 [Ophiocordyceps australis]|uniref:Mannose-6-phosphate isomerase cupin domain-containing protein n=1 Tax=Ophiocordyceps australis TaxID=1399860 RepID=A0A2C5YDR1_9HYPO|nr:hypothetical protein CDD81_1470 [Ophiocordyceps australis]
MAPIPLPANQPEHRMYAGGARITAFRHIPPCSSYQPEDWVASTTCCSGSNSIGLSPLPDGTLLRDAIASDPDHWLGAQHVAKFGPDTKLLVKLLDAGQRLPVHAHPSGEWAKRNLNVKHGKAEAWYILTPGSVWLGLEKSIDDAELLQLVEAERGHEIVERMHRIDVEPHQTVYVQPGMLHCIGDGVMVLEVQEPEDLSILCEWGDFRIDGPNKGHLGLGFAKALTAIETSARTREEIYQLVTKPNDKSSDSVYVPSSQQYFCLEKRLVAGTETCRRGFAILIVLDGDIALSTQNNTPEKLALSTGATVVVPFADGDLTLEGSGDVLIARPPQ